VKTSDESVPPVLLATLQNALEDTLDLKLTKNLYGVLESSAEL